MISNKILIVSPHISDACMQCGGSIYKWAELDKSIYVYSLGPPSGEDWKRELKVAHLLGFTPVNTINGIADKFQVGNFDSGKAFVFIKDLLKQLRPSTVITVSSKEVQRDHLITYQATRDAVYYASREVYWDVGEIYKPQFLVTDCMESFSFVRADEWEELNEEQVLSKRRALLIYDYTPEAEKGPHFDVVHDSQWVNCLAKLRGLWVGCEYAEVFQKEEVC